MMERHKKRTSGRSVKPIDRTIGQNIKTFRLLASMSQQVLAEKLGISFQQLQKYERGDNRVSASRLLELSEVFGCDVTELYGVGSNNSSGLRSAEEDVLKIAAAYQKITSAKERRIAYDLVKSLADGK